MRKTWVEVTCDACGSGITHVRPGQVSRQLRERGVIVSKYGDFCDKLCKSVKQAGRLPPVNDITGNNTGEGHEA